MSNVMDKIKRLCDELGEKYFVSFIDGADVICRDFGNGYDVEITGFYANTKHEALTICLWKDKTRLLKTIKDVPYRNVGDRAEELYRLTLSQDEWKE